MAFMGTAGFGAIPGATEERAIANIQEFVTQLQIEAPVEIERLSKDDEDGWYGFRLVAGNRTCHVLMPGVGAENVQYKDEPGQHVKNFWRVYVDGGGWLWFLGLEEARTALTGSEESDRDA